MNKSKRLVFFKACLFLALTSLLSGQGWAGEEGKTEGPCSQFKCRDEKDHDTRKKCMKEKKACWKENHGKGNGDGKWKDRGASRGDKEQVLNKIDRRLNRLKERQTKLTEEIKTLEAQKQEWENKK